MISRKQPGYTAWMREHIRDLETRTVDNLRALHYLIEPSGLRCLDLDLRAATVDELDALCVIRLAELPTFGPMPNVVAPDEWMRLALGKEVGRHILFVPGHHRRMIVVTIQP